MRMREVHTVPLWQEDDGWRTPGIVYRPDHGEVVGWCNAALVEIHGETRWFLLTLDAAR